MVNKKEEATKKKPRRKLPASVVVAVNPDGTVDSVFDNARDAAKYYKIHVSSISKSCCHNRVCMGKKWFYEKDFKRIYMNCETEKLKFTLPENYHPGRWFFYKGHNRGNGYEKLSEENKRKIRENAVKLAERLCKTGLNTKGAWKRRKPVVCITDGMEFPSIRHASEHYGISQSCISQCVNSIGSTHNLKFRLKSQLEKVKKIV